MLVAMVLVLGALPFDATPSLAAKRVARSSWPLGVSEAPRAPVATRSGRAVVALGSDRVFVFGGGKMGEGVSKPDGHDDGAILTLATKRWSRTARAPFKVVGPGGVWTGRKVIVVGGAPRCTIDNPGFRQCRTAVTKAGVYDPATDSWHEFNVPAAFKRFLGASPLMWTGKEALFLQGQEILALSPSGRFRAIDIPSTVAVGWTCATKNAIATMDSHVARDPAAAVTQLQIYDPRTDRWTASSPSPGDTGAVSPASGMGPLERDERQEHGTTPAPVMGPPRRQ
ncbi:MAG TPA: hypothetical protein VFW97_01020 [Acidimicrobiia bacterium]|nr:hypothetical protein [Acidimicrobiia bacterium]